MFTIPSGGRARRFLALACLAVAAFCVATTGQATAAVYPAGGSTFTGSAEGWSGTSSCDLSATLLCETSAGYDGTAGDPAGSLDVKSQVLLNALALFKVTAGEESPGFTVTEGGSGTLRLERQFEPGGLLPLTPHATYTATLVDHTAGTRQQAIAETIEAASGFTAKSGSVTLVAGHTYSVVIAAEENSTLASLGLTGTSDLRFDDVSVSGSGSGSGGEGSGGSGGEGGSGSGAGGVSSSRLESLISSAGLVGPAVMKGSKLTVKAKCPKKVGATCTLALQGMLTKHKVATTVRKAKVKKGKTKTFVLKVKPAARKKLAAKKKLLFKEKVKVGKAKATVWKSLKLVHK